MYSPYIVLIMGMWILFWDAIRKQFFISAPPCCMLHHTWTLRDIQMTTNENIDERIESWHTSDSVEPIYEYLGLTMTEYLYWVENGTLPQKGWV